MNESLRCAELKKGFAAKDLRGGACTKKYFKKGSPR